MRKKRKQSEGIKERWRGRGANLKIQIEDLRGGMLTPAETYRFMHSSRRIDENRGKGAVNRRSDRRKKVEKKRERERKVEGER